MSHDSPSDVAKLRAKAAFSTCLRLSVQHRPFNEDARACEAWLARSFPAEHRRVEELAVPPRA